MSKYGSPNRGSLPCSACHARVPLVANYYSAHPTGLGLAIVLGESSTQGALADLSYCQSYAAQYAGIPLSNFYLDASGGQPHDTLFGLSMGPAR